MAGRSDAAYKSTPLELIKKFAHKIWTAALFSSRYLYTVGRFDSKEVIPKNLNLVGF